MAQSNGRKLYFGGVLILAVAVTATGTSALASQDAVSDERGAAVPATTLAAIATTVDSPPVPGDSTGTCSVCFANTDGDSSGSSASVSIYFEDDGQDFSGDFDLTLQLLDESYRDASITSCSILDQSAGVYTVPAGSDWDWNDVDRVTIVAVPDE